MKLLVGISLYLATVAALVGATFAAFSSLERSKPADAPVLARADEGEVARQEKTREEIKTDPNRVPVWIVATPKYDYTPPPPGSMRPARSLIIGDEARGALAKVPPPRKPRPDTIERPAAQPALRAADSRRDNDPFYRD
jgi:hypothetical protein